MRAMRFLLPFVLSAACFIQAAEESYPVHEDSKVHEGVPKGEMIKASYTAKENSVFPGTEREYQLYIPAGLDKTKPAPFMVFQDGVIYNAPIVFDNLIAKKEIPAMIGIFIKPGVVPAANPEALPRFNRSYEYDSVTDTYSRFLIDEFLPAITQKHGITLSTDPNDAGISGNSSGGICAFMVAWHRSDRFRRVFTGVGTYVGIHGADQLPVLVRKMEPKPIKVYLQSGENDNNLYCGDWWMANQMMERSLTWSGYDVAHTWGTGGHNGKQATAIFPDVMRWLWKGYPDAKIKVNPEGKSKWLGYQVLKEGSEWEEWWKDAGRRTVMKLRSNVDGDIAVYTDSDVNIPVGDVLGNPHFTWIRQDKSIVLEKKPISDICAFSADGRLITLSANLRSLTALSSDGAEAEIIGDAINVGGTDFILNYRGQFFSLDGDNGKISSGQLKPLPHMTKLTRPRFRQFYDPLLRTAVRGAFSPDQTQIYTTQPFAPSVSAWSINPDGLLSKVEAFYSLAIPPDNHPRVGGLCVDTEGRLYVATAMGIQVCDQAGRVNFIIPVPPKEPGYILTTYDVCFGGKELSELFIASGDKIYKRSTKVHGVVSGQQPPIKPAPPKL